MLHFSLKITQKKWLSISAFFMVCAYSKSTLALHNQTGYVMRHFYLDFIIIAIALMIAAWWGYSHGGMGGLIATLSITAILAVMEISLSFDSAVVNASVLKGWSRFGHRRFFEQFKRA